MAYRARGFGENALYKILSDYWRTFLGAYEACFQHTCGALRSVTGRVVERFLDCGNPMNGFARIKCSDCGAERLLHFSCKTRGFCPSCQARRSEERSRWFAETLSAPVPHHQIVFTIPKMLRAYFRHDRTLMSDLSRAAYRAVARFVEKVAGPGARPAMVIVKHTFGGGRSLARVARYMLRAPLMLSRISYDRDRATVRVEPHGSRAREATELDVLDFIARLTAQIPEPHERLVHYYGPYSKKILFRHRSYSIHGILSILTFSG